MQLLDRYILIRFLTNFVILFVLLYTLAVTIDLILNLDRFIDAARDSQPEDAGLISVTLAFLKIAGDFQLPKLFQFFAYLHGLVAIGAMGFTLALMHKHRELVAVMASGMSLYRVALPFVVAVFALSIVQLLNQELIIPRIAPLLLRGHGQIGQMSVPEFEVRLTRDSRGNLLQSPSFSPRDNSLASPTILERGPEGMTVRRIVAERAEWDASEFGWRLVEGRATRLRLDEPGLGGPQFQTEPVNVYHTDLSPQVLTVHRHGEFATMLSLRQINEMLETRGVKDARWLLRNRYSRFAAVLVNLLVLCLTLPCFLLREPANLLQQSLLCAALTIPTMLGAAIGMTVDLPGIPPAAGVFLPVVILLFLAIVPWTSFRT